MNIHKYSNIFGKIAKLFHHAKISFQKIKARFFIPICLPPPTVILILLLLPLIVYCTYQRRQVNQMMAITTCLRHTVHRQHDTIQEQDDTIQEQGNLIMDQQQKILNQSQALLEMSQGTQDISDQLSRMGRKIARLATLEEDIRQLANLKALLPSPVQVGMGGTALEPAPNLSLSFVDSSPGTPTNEMDDLQAKINITHQQLTRHMNNFKSLKEDLKIQYDIRVHTPSIKPAPGIISCGFGNRISPFSRKPEFHTGMDIANRKGTPVVASARGTVVFAQKKYLIGNLVVIDHGNNIITKYGHLDKILVKKNDLVNAGDPIGLMGNTGKSTGPHVHYEVLVNGKPQDPARYFSSEMATAYTQPHREEKK